MSVTEGQGQQRAAIAIVEGWLDRERDQLANWIPVGMGVGVAFWQVWGNDGAAFILLLALAAIAIIWLLPAGTRVRALLRGALIAIIFGFCMIALKSAVVAEPVLGKIWIGEFYGRVANVEHLTARETVRITLETDERQGLPPKVRVNLSEAQHREAFTAGAIIRLKARLMPPAGPALPGGYDFARRAWFYGIGATGTALGEPALHMASPHSDDLSSIRTRLSRHVMANMPSGSGGIGAALVTGDQGNISEADAEAMRNSGMAHLLSISGLHVTAVVGAIFLLVSRILALFPALALRAPIPLIAAGFAAVGAIGYTLLTGAEVPTVRSCIAALLVLAALALGRDALTLRVIAFGAAFVITFWPETMAGPSFQLSFAAVTTIIVLHDMPWMQRLVARREEHWGWRIARGILSLLITGLAIELVLTPIALFHFHKAGLYGAMANVIAIPLTTFFVMPMEALALLFDLVGLGAPFWWLTGQGVHAILAIAHTVSALPGSVSMLPSMPVWAYGAMILGGLTVALFRTRVRYLGFIPIAVGVIAMLTAPRPDMLVTGDGKHLALISADGRMALLRSGAGDYIRDMLKENAGVSIEPIEIEDWPGVKCSRDNCIFDVASGGRRWFVMATRTRTLVPSMELAAACKRVDIVVSDRWLPVSCKPRWFKADRNSLARTGGLSIYFSEQRIDSVAAGNQHMPWVKAAKLATERAAADKKKASASVSPKPSKISNTQ